MGLNCFFRVMKIIFGALESIFLVLFSLFSSGGGLLLAFTGLEGF